MNLELNEAADDVEQLANRIPDFELFIGGGAIRDALAGNEVHDVDLMEVPRPEAQVGDPAVALREARIDRVVELLDERRT